ncbi:MAG: hypothetical protein ABIE25_06345 [Thermoplasmatota archaeon]
MILHRLRISNYRDVNSAEISPLPKGITIVLGPNETGKTCFAEALRLVLHELDSSQKQSVKAVKPVHRDVGSEVEVEIETGPYRFVLFKSFNKGKETRLTVTQPKPESLPGRQAHERVQQMLQETLDLDLWNALCIVQGMEVTQPALSGHSSLSAALDKAAGAVPAGECEESLFESVVEEYQKYYTPKVDEEKGILKDAKQRVSELEATVSTLKDRSTKIERDVNRSDELTKALQELGVKHESSEKSAKDLKARWEEALGKQATVSELESQRKVAESNQKMAQQSLAERKAFVAEVDEFHKALNEHSEGFKDTDEELRKRTLQLRELEKKVAALDAELDSARQLEGIRRKDAEYLHSKLDLAQMKERLERVKGAEKAASEAARVLAVNRVDNKALECIREAQQQVEFAKGKLAAGVPSVTIQALANIKLAIRGRSVRLKAKETLEEKVPDAMSVRVPQVIELEVRPGTSADELRKSLQKAEKQLRKLLDKYDVADIQAAIQANSNHSDATSKRQELNKVLKENLRDLSREDLEAKVLEMKERDRSYRKSRPERPPIASSREEAKKLLKDVEDAAAETVTTLKSIQKQADSARNGHADVSSKQVELKTTIEMTRGRLAITERKLADARASAVDKMLDDHAYEASVALRDLEDRLKTAKTEIKRLDVEVLRARCENADSTLAQIVSDITQLEKESTEVSARIQMYEEEGLFDKLQTSESHLEHALRERGRLLRLAQASKLLYEVMNSARKAAQEAYIRPLKERIERLGKVVFGDSFAISMNPDLTVAERTLNDRTVPFESLSKGAQEQIGMITRLACAMIVSKDGGVPVIIDDALGYTDPRRLEAMGAVLGLAGKECQIVILTCMPDRYQCVGGAKVIKIGAQEPGAA